MIKLQTVLKFVFQLHYLIKDRFFFLTIHENKGKMLVIRKLHLTRNG